MTTFRTIVPIQQPFFSLEQGQNVLLSGSCFTEHMGTQLQAVKFDTLVNPFGIVYNPVSLASAIDRILEGNRPFVASELSLHQGLWHSWEHHGVFSDPDPEVALQGINHAYQEAAAFLRQTDCLILTFGTATVYRLVEDGRIVANCHKAPAQAFEKNRLSIDQMEAAVRPMLDRLRRLRPNIRLVLSISPVRHLRDGAIENQRSKAALVLLVERLCAAMPDLYYFPAYEILMDELRDYRFYTDDMAHPAPLAIDYIWKQFSNVFFSVETRQLNVVLGRLNKALEHRPFRPDTPAHRQFVEKQLEIVEHLEGKYPILDFSNEKEALLRQ